MLCWITDFLDEVKKNPKKYNENIKNQCRLIKELLSRPNIEYKESDPIAFVDFCGLFTHQKGEWAGQPFVPDETQKFLIACVMGIKYYDKKYNQWLRYFRHCNLFVARKYGKSFLAAAFVLWFLGLDKENGAEVKIIAENKTITFKQCDAILIDKGEKYRWEVCNVVMACSPAWTPKQHKMVK